jgi:hypothetical protein
MCSMKWALLIRMRLLVNTLPNNSVFAFDVLQLIKSNLRDITESEFVLIIAAQYLNKGFY